MRCTMQFEMKLMQFCILWFHYFGFVFPGCDEFGAAPSAIVIIPEGGEISLFCEYNRPARVDWYKENILVAPSGDNRQLCDCTSTAINTGRLLTFSNFRSENSAGQYGCWAHVQTGFDECNFEVVVAVSPVIKLNQSNVTGNQLNGDLSITPTINFGLPEAVVTWSRNSEDLYPSDPRVAISSEGVLTVTGVQASDRGVYTITAYNTAEPDGVTASVRVNINFVEVEGPTFRYLENDGLEVNCVATGYPAPVIAILSPLHTGNSARNFLNGFHITKYIRYIFPMCNSATTYTCMATSGTEYFLSKSAIPTCNSQPGSTPDRNSSLGAQANTSCGAKLNPASIVILVFGIILIVCSPLVVVVVACIYKSRRAEENRRVEDIRARKDTNASETPAAPMYEPVVAYRHESHDYDYSLQD